MFISILCYISSFQHVISLLQKGYDPNKQDLTNDSLAPLHAIVRTKLKDRAECLEALLTYGDVKVNLCAAHKMTGLHFAAMVSPFSFIYKQL